MSVEHLNKCGPFVFAFHGSSFCILSERRSLSLFSFWMVGFVQESPSGTHTASPGNLPTLQPENAAEGPKLQSSEGADGEDKTGGAVDGERVPEPEPMELDNLNDFLPPVPTEKYAGELQVRAFNGFHRLSTLSFPFGSVLYGHLFLKEQEVQSGNAESFSAMSDTSPKDVLGTNSRVSDVGC